MSFTTSEPNVEIQYVTETKEQITPLDDRVVVEPLDRERVSKGGIIIPENAKQNRESTRGIVIAIGPNVTELVIGDMAIYGKYVGNDVKAEGWPNGLLLVRESDVLAKVVKVMKAEA